MKIADIVELGASVVKGGVALWQGVTRLSPDPGDVEPLGEGDVFQGLGLSSCPYPSDANGKAEGLCFKGVGGRNSVYAGARDTRSAAIVGKLKPGDTVLHSTGPSQAAQVQCKEERRQVLMATKDGQKRTMVVLLDGEANKFQVALAGTMFEIDGNTGNFTITNGQASILMQGDTVCIDANVILGGTKADPLQKVAIGLLGPAPSLPTPSPGAPLPLLAAPSVSVALPVP